MHNLAPLHLAGPSLLIGQGTAPEADSYLRLKLADEDDDIFILFQSKFHQTYGAGKELNVKEEYVKARVPGVPDDRQLFVLYTDAAVGVHSHRHESRVGGCR